MSAIAKDSLVTYVGTWLLGVGDIPYGDTSEEMVAAVSNELAGYGLLVAAADFPVKFNLITQQPINVKLTLKTMQQTTDRDVKALVRESVWKVTGSYPLADSIPYIGVSRTGEPEPEIEPKPTGSKWIVAGLIGALVLIMLGAGAAIYVRR